MRTLLALTLVLTCGVGLADELPTNTREIETLTVEQAETLIGRNQWSLYLDGLTTLAPDVAKTLAQVKGKISLNGLTTLSKETAEQLAAPPREKHQSRSLSLDGLTTLSPAVAEELVKIKGSLSLGGLAVVSPELAAVLITHHSFKDGDFGLESISPDLARVLARSESHLDLIRLKRLDPQTASAFSQHTASIGLSGLQLIDRDTAQALAKYRGMAIVLSGLRSIKTDVASELSHWPGEKLYLDGLAQINPETAACLAECKAKQLGLSGLNSISPEVAAELAKFSGSSLNLSGLTQPSLDVIQCLGNFHGSLNLGGLSSIDEEKAKAIGSLPSDRLQLSATNDSFSTGSGWSRGGDSYDFHADFRDSRDGYSNPASINPGIAAALSLFKGKELVLRGLTTIDKESAQALSSFKGERLSLECLDRLDDVTFELLEKIPTIEIKLEDFRRLTARQAKTLVETENKKGYSYLGNLEFIDKAVAKELLEFKGNLGLHRLKSIDDEALEILKQRPNFNLNLDSLSSLTTKQLRQLLAEKKGGYLSLQLEILTPEMARILSSYDGEVNLYELQTLSDECFDILIESDLKRPQYQRMIRNLRSLTPHQASVLSEHLDEDEFNHILLNLDAIDVPLARWLIENREYIDCPGADVDQEVVKILAGHKGGLDFHELDWRNISPEFASALSGFQGNLSFSWDVTQLPNEAELIFATIPGTLDASYLHEIKTPELVKKLVESHNKQEFYGNLYFEELQTLSIPVAKELVKAKGGLFLPSITTLSEDIAAILATCQDKLYLPGLTQLESLPLAEKFLGTTEYFRSPGTGIELNNLTGLSPVIAEVLSKYEAGLSLNGLRDISPATARNLMNCEGRLVIGLPELTPEIAKILVHYRGDLVLNIENLTPEAARVLINRQGDLKLGLKHLTSDVAKILVNRHDPLWIGEATVDEELADILAQTRGDLYVELRTMTPQIAAALVRKEGTLVLWGLQGDRSLSTRSSQLSKEVAKQLASTKGTILLSLQRNSPLLGIQQGFSNWEWNLDREIAEILAETEGTLILDGLRWIGFDVAESLSTLKGTLFLPSMSIADFSSEGSALLTKPNIHVGRPHFGKSLSAEEAAVLVLIQSVNSLAEKWGCPRSVETITDEAAIELADYRGDFLNLHGVTTLSPKAAKALAPYHGRLILDALENLPPEVAKQLIKCKGELSLPKLAKPTPEVCEILASCSGPLQLSGLTELESVDLASKLVANTSESDWMLNFDGLTSISLPIATALARSHATLSFAGLTAISEKQAKALARCNGGLSLDGLTQLTAETAKELAHCEGYLILNGLTTIDPKVAEILSNARGKLGLGGLHSLRSVALAQKLVADANKEAPDDEWTGERGLVLDSLKTVTPAVAEVLSGTNGLLYLRGLEEIDAEVAQALTGFAGVLSLDGLKMINARIAESLSQSRDSLSLAGLESITADVANELAKFKGDLNLSGLKEPKEEIVQALEKKKMGTLYLSQDVLDKFPVLAKNELVEVGYGGGMFGGMF